MATERFTAWTRRRVGRAAGSLATILIGLKPSTEMMASKKRRKRKRRRKTRRNACMAGLETTCMSRDDCCGQECCKLPSELIGTCCTAEAPGCLTFPDEGERFCMA
jgi:hypothetical protein